MNKNEDHFQVKRRSLLKIIGLGMMVPAGRSWAGIPGENEHPHLGADNSSYDESSNFTMKKKLSDEKNNPFIVVAPVDAPDKLKEDADLVLFGSDDQTKLQKAMDAMPHGGVLHIMPGTVVFSEPLRIPAFVTVQGSGIATLVKTNEKNITWGSTEGVITMDSDQSVLKNIRVHGGYDGYSVIGGNRSSCIVLKPSSTRCVIEGVSCSHSSRHGIFVLGERHRIANIYITATGRHGISFGSGAGSCRDNTLDGARIENIFPRRSAVEINDGAHRINVSNIWARGCQAAIRMIDHRRPGDWCYDINITNVIGTELERLVFISGRSGNTHRRIKIANVIGEGSVGELIRIFGGVDTLSVTDAACKCTGSSIIISEQEELVPKNLWFTRIHAEGSGEHKDNGAGISDAERLTLTDCCLTRFGRNGLLLKDVRDIAIRGCRLIDNSRQSQTAKYGAVVMDGHVSDIRISESQLGRAEGETDAYVVKYTADCFPERVVIENNQTNGVPTIFSLHDRLPGPETVIRNNQGIVTKNSGTAVMEPEITSVSVPHGLDRKPDLQGIQITLAGNPGEASGFWIDSVDDKTFNIRVNHAPKTGPAVFVWQAQSEYLSNRQNSGI